MSTTTTYAGAGRRSIGHPWTPPGADAQRIGLARRALARFCSSRNQIQHFISVRRLGHRRTETELVYYTGLDRSGVFSCHVLLLGDGRRESTGPDERIAVLPTDCLLLRRTWARTVVLCVCRQVKRMLRCLNTTPQVNETRLSGASSLSFACV